MIFAFLCLIGLIVLNFGNAQLFEAVAYGSRAFTENADAFLGFDEDLGDIVIAEGFAFLVDAPTLGTIKQSNCVDVVDVEGVISFSNEELSFCYEGGPQMVKGVSDRATFDIVGDDGTTSTYEVRFAGSDPVVALGYSDRLVLTQENVPVTINVGTAFAVFNEDVTEIDSFKIQITQVPLVAAGFLTDASGNVIVDGAVFNNDEIITFTPSEDYSNCNPNTNLDNACENLIQFGPSSSDDKFVFNIIFGEAQDEVTGEERLSFFLLVEFRTVGRLVVNNETFTIRVQEEINNIVTFDLDTSIVSVVVDEEEDIDRLLIIRFFALSNAIRIEREETALFDLERLSIVTCGFGFEICELEMVGTQDAINEAITKIVSLNFKANELKAEDALLLIMLNGIELELIFFEPSDALEAVAFGNRLFTVNPQNFLNVDEDDTPVIIVEGDATLKVAPNQGILKQSDCVDAINVNDVITFENEELVFCYEGSPEMLKRVEDTIIFDIVGSDGTTASLELNFVGSDPVVPVIFNLIQTIENEPLDVSVTDLAIFEADVDLLDEFQIQIDQVPSPTVGVFTNLAGDLITNGMLLNSDEVITFTPTKDFFNCATFEDLFQQLCADIIDDPEISPDQFQFSIIFGAEEDIVVREPTPFSILVELKTVGSLVIESETILVPVEDAVDGIATLALNTSFLSVIVEDAEDLNSLLSIRFTTLTSNFLALEPQPIAPQGIRGFGTVGCGSSSVCEIFMAGVEKPINRAIDDEIITLIFFANQVANAALQVSLNGGEQVQTLTFEPVGEPPVDDPPATNSPTTSPPDDDDTSEDDDEGLSDAGIIFVTFGVFAGVALVGWVIYVIGKKVKGEKEEGEVAAVTHTESTKNPMHTL